MKNIFAAFHERSFLFLWLGEVCTQVAVNLFNFYLILVVFSLTKSNTAVAGAVLSFTIPAILFGIPAGVYVDRWNKKKVLYVTNILRAVLLIILFFMHTNLFAIYTISFIFSLITQFFIPAESPMIPMLVQGRHLFSANALFGIGIYGSILLAYMLSGPMLLIQGPQLMLLSMIGLLLLSALIIVGIRMPDVHVKERGEGYVELAIKREIHSALTQLARSRALYGSLFLLATAQVLILLLASIAPGYASQVLNLKVEEFPLLFIAPGVAGMILGGGILVHYFEHIRREKLVTYGTFLASFSMILLPFCSSIASREFVQSFNNLPYTPEITNFHMVIFLAFLLGIANALIFVPSNTILQEKTEEESRGKIYGVLNAVVGIFSLIPLIVVGGLSDLIGVPSVLVGIGLILGTVGIIRVVISR